MHYSHSDSTAKCAPAERAKGIDPSASAGLRAPLYVGSDVFRRAAFGSHHPLNIVRHSAVLDLVSQGVLDAEPRHRYPLAEAARCHADLEGRRTVGSIVLEP